MTLNQAVWLDGPGKAPRIDSAPMPEPDIGQLLVRTQAVAVQPGEWKIQAGLIPVPLTYPTIIGLSLSGIVEKVGPGVTRFSPGDRVASNTTGVLRNDPHFGAYQRYTLVPQELTCKIGGSSFEDAASIVTGYAGMSALFYHLGLERPPNRLQRWESRGTKETLLIWGISSSFGHFSAQVAQDAGYAVVGVGSAHHVALTEGLGAIRFVNRDSPTLVTELVSIGPFKAVLAAADSAEDQITIGQVLAAHGGGRFLSTMGLRDGVRLPQGVTGFFRQFLDDYIDPGNSEFTRWVWWDYFEAILSDGRVKSIPLEFGGGLAALPHAWDQLKTGMVGGKRIIISPQVE
ncbi:GroES-like protein [Thozetella sp. PMI_491]|nr:GroES-like protein [Thozetella sp. PMI_491]